MKYIAVFLFMLLSIQLNAQKSVEDLLKQYNKNLVPYVTAEELAMPKNEAILLDAREPAEYQISHLKDAISVGYDEFDLNQVTELIDDKDQPIVVYCSLGIRSETVANKLKEAGYNNVQNLYGGIFEWKNKDFEVYNSNEKLTDSVHAFSEAWGKWLTKGIKVYNEIEVKNKDD
ncbi:MAG: rhodanese-like domain-containing protein [Bacteroidota bacterium]